MNRPLIALALLGPSLGACAQGTERYPSLAPRAVEKLSFAEPAAVPVTIAPDPALDAKIATLGAQIDAIARGFAADAMKADRLAQAAKGQAAGSERWIDAQTALAALDDWRAQASATSTDAEQLAIDRATTLAPAYPALTALQAKAQSEAEAESATITRISAMLPQA